MSSGKRKKNAGQSTGFPAFLDCVVRNWDAITEAESWRPRHDLFNVLVLHLAWAKAQLASLCDRCRERLVTSASLQPCSLRATGFDAEMQVSTFSVSANLDFLPRSSRIAQEDHEAAHLGLCCFDGFGVNFFTRLAGLWSRSSEDHRNGIRAIFAVEALLRASISPVYI